MVLLQDVSGYKGHLRFLLYQLLVRRGNAHFSITYAEITQGKSLTLFKIICKNVALKCHKVAKILYATMRQKNQTHFLVQVKNYFFDNENN